MKPTTKAYLFDFFWKAGATAGITLATFHLCIADLARLAIQVDQTLFPTVEAKAPRLSLFPWKLPARKLVLPTPADCKRDYKAIQALDCKELLAVLKEAGFQGEALKTAYAVARAESSGRPKAFNGNTRTGDQSYGIFQINMLNRLGPARRKAYGLKSNDELYDPLVNAKAAYAISNGGKNWQPWGAYTNLSYQRHLAEAGTISLL